MPDKNEFNNTVLLITHEGMGSADVELQHKLIDTYFMLLIDSNDIPEAVCFYTDGVKLVVEGSPLLKRLAELEAKGARLIACSTCLDYFGLKDALRVGNAGGMVDIIEAQSMAGKVITL